MSEMNELRAENERLREILRDNYDFGDMECDETLRRLSAKYGNSISGIMRGVREATRAALAATSTPEAHPDTVRLDALERRLFVLRVWIQHADDGDTLRNLADRLITPPPHPEILTDIQSQSGRRNP